LGETLCKLGRLDEAAEGYRKAVALNPSAAWSHFNLGEALEKLGKTEEAIASYQQAVQLNPKSSLLQKTGDKVAKGSMQIRRLVATRVIEKIWKPNFILDSYICQSQENFAKTKRKSINTIVILTCVWKRPELVKIVLSYYSHLKRELAGKIKLELLAVGSEGKTSRHLCKQCGFDYVEYANSPLSAKWEYGLNQCASYDPDAVIVVGSDDLISQSLIEFYNIKLQENLVFCGLKDGYFFDLANESLILWTGYNVRADPTRVGETIGMGRCLSRTLLDKLEFSIWRGLDIDRGLDGAMTRKLVQLGLQFLEYDDCVIAQIGDHTLRIGHCGFKMAEIGAYAVDIKVSENITPLERYFERDANTLVVQPQPWMIFGKYFPHQIIDQLKELAIVTSKGQTNGEECKEFKGLQQMATSSENFKKAQTSPVVDVETELRQENELLLYQLGEVQDELEEYYLKYQNLKNHVKLS
ncbi:tetratricopeptide repeat protein, partial [Limnoraphis robusta]